MNILIKDCLKSQKNDRMARSKCRLSIHINNVGAFSDFEEATVTLVTNLDNAIDKLSKYSSKPLFIVPTVTF